MEHQRKPVPNCPELAYRGTPEHPDIKIFVSQRIDMDHVVTVNGPVHIPVRCGAVYDTRGNTSMLGDDTGDNISEKRGSFCEMTVQYWAWKNVEADYYGFCHYRRYFSFSSKIFKINPFSQIVDPILCDHTIRKYRLTDETQIIDAVSPYDIVTHTAFDVRGISSHPKNVWERWELFPEGLKKESLSLLMDVITEKAPDYHDAAKSYFSQNCANAYNCYIMKKAAFHEYCEFAFPILFEVEKRLDTTGYSQQLLRTPAFLAESLGDIFLWKVQQEQKYRIGERQLVFFSYVTDDGSLFTEYCLAWGRKIVASILPDGSKRRAIWKKIIYRLLGKTK